MSTTEYTIESSAAVSAVEHAEAMAREHAEDLGVFATSFYDIAREEAQGTTGPLAGVTLGVKDIIFESTARTAAGSKVELSPWPRNQPESTAVSRLKAAGAVVVGKTTTMEYALGVPDVITSRNPWNPARWAGGSSSGSGVGVMTDCFTAAIGTDTTGSLRIPAAYTGATAIKPTFGLVSTDGIYPLAPSMDTVGPIARSVDLCARLLDVMAQPNSTDTGGDRSYASAATESPGGLRIGRLNLDPFADDGIDPLHGLLYSQTGNVMNDLELDTVELALPQYPLLNVVGNVLMLAEAHEIHRDTLSNHWKQYGRGARWVFSAGSSISSADYLRARRLQRVLMAAVDALFDVNGVDVVLAATNHVGAPLIDHINPLNPASYLPSMHTTAWSVTGHPVVTLPIGLDSNGMPLSMSLIARRGRDRDAIRVAAAFQAVTDHHTMEAPR
ncbi:aspartyl-tRNA(Asn)/glutamyl-tRNA(Gln) amidotransferase subunit A [Rhodococcus fascians]|uniref:amidase n=1 Tax=Nocardiaceae TaxID=85025 RepID=UPI0028599111|nr:MULTISPECIES: amidase [Rhodococcus]MDR6912934.1 aspartyl-tRNA(Asn)/glutamyl-tRNA(Gln) amidotransferase subunit A [Rhodococcus sp. 3258]MDR6934531.1 aspartyl-tRNA(Asn)/glutamyl-tRNA(Gln) amidotransferase subunit A [Rhodococcus fascians]